MAEGYLPVDLSGRTALVTGASQGLGRAIALGLGARGARVACVARNAEKLQETVDLITAAGGSAEAFPCDVVDGAAVAALVEGLVEKWERLDILVNNAGVTRDTLLARMDEDAWDTVLDTNLKGAFLFTKAATMPMMQQRHGRIINISSVSGLAGNPGQANYSASKAGLIGFTRTVAKELGKRKITCNAVAPGFIESEMTAVLGAALMDEVKKRVPAQRIGRPEEVANAVLYLASDEAAYVTGHVLVLDGGLTS